MKKYALTICLILIFALPAFADAKQGVSHSEIETASIANVSKSETAGVKNKPAKVKTRKKKSKRRKMKPSWFSKLCKKYLPLYAEYETTIDAKGKEVFVRKNGKRVRTMRSFVVYKSSMLISLLFAITLGIILAQILEVSGLIAKLAFIMKPITKLGKIGDEAGPAFMMAFQSGAIANGMLVSSRNDGSLDSRELYTSVFVVSCISLFAHLPAIMFPVAGVTSMEVALLFFSVKLAAITAEIIVILLVSKLIVKPFLAKKNSVSRDDNNVSKDQLTAVQRISKKAQARLDKAEHANFWDRVFKRSNKTIKRVAFYLLPTFILFAGLEYYGAFVWLRKTMPGLFSLSFLPPEALKIIPMQAASLYNGAAAAGECTNLTAKQIAFILLVGSMITAPIRTFKHAMPTYVAMLGPVPGVIMSISAQALRILFLLVCTILMWICW